MPRNMRWFPCIASTWLLGVLLLLLGAAPYAAGQCYYTYEQLPEPPPGWFFGAVDMNELGHVAALMQNGGDFTRAAFWSPETGIRLVPKPPGIRSMEVGGLNDHDVICGQMTGSAGRFGFLWDRATDQVTFIDLPEGAERVEMNAINNANYVAATLYFWEPPFAPAVSWYDGAFHSVSAEIEAETAHAYANNELRETAGDYGDDYWNIARGFVADGSDLAWLPHPQELTITFPEDMSNNGYFAGRGTTAPSGDPDFAYRGVVWDPGGGAYVLSPPRRIRDVYIKDVNDSGRAVGFTYGENGMGAPPLTALMWQQGVQSDLNTLVPGLSGLYMVSAINDRGQIQASGSAGAFVLSPVWLPGDLTGDCHVSVEDLILVLSNFGQPQGSFPRGDVDLDGDVDLSDLTILLAHWGE